MIVLWLALLSAFFFFFSSFCRPQLQSWQKNYTKCEHSFPLVFGRSDWLLMHAIFPPCMCSAYGRDWWRKYCCLCFLASHHEIDLGAGKPLPMNFPSVSGLRFGICCVWLYMLHRKQCLLSCLPLPVCRRSAQCAGMCMTMRTVNIWAVWWCQETSPWDG